jgi:hypothetical protein
MTVLSAVSIADSLPYHKSAGYCESTHMSQQLCVTDLESAAGEGTGTCFAVFQLLAVDGDQLLGRG